MQKQSNILSEEPIRDLLMTLIGKLLSFCLTNKIVAALLFYSLLLLLPWFTSDKLRFFLSNTKLSILIIFLFIVLSWVIFAIFKNWGWLPDGKPLFGRLGGPGKRIIKNVQLAQTYVDFDLKDKDKISINNFKNSMLARKFHEPAEI